MREIQIDRNRFQVLLHYADLYGLDVKDLILKLVYESFGMKVPKFKKKGRLYYFDPDYVTVDQKLKRKIEERIEKHEQTKVGFKISRKFIINEILNDFTKDQEMILKKEYEHRKIFPKPQSIKGGKKKLSKADKDLNTTFDIEGKVKKSPEFIPIQ